MTHPFAPLLILFLAVSYLAMVYAAFALVQTLIRRQQQIPK